MKEAFKHIGRLLLGLLLIIVAIVLCILITPIALIRTIYLSIFHENRKARDILTGISTYFISLAISIDKFGNCAFGGLLDDLFLINKKYQFGNTHETISEVLGWAEYYNDLTDEGKFLVYILDRLDKDHCRLAMESGINNAHDKMEMVKQINNES